MKLIDAQTAVRNLIAAHPTYAATAATGVLIDLGHVRAELEHSLKESVNGYCVGVWPLARGHAFAEEQGAGISRVDGVIVARLEVNPKKLKALRQAQAGSELTWLNAKINDLMKAVISETPDAGGEAFRLAEDAFELVNFDEGLAAWHFRFVRLAVV
jgi:hypothetical protein